VSGLEDFRPRTRPERVVLEGRYCRLEPLDPERHGEALFAASAAPGAEERFRYLADPPPDADAFAAWALRAARSEDPLFHAVVDGASGRCEGRQAYLRITPEHGAIEIGHVLWGPAIARTRVATEALYLHAAHAFDALGYRRFEWKCDALNERSRKSALRFGFKFEGVQDSHFIIKGRNRDSAWFRILAAEWPQARPKLEALLAG
jgi:RimJ/RimL family protein N-acetyltransferase